MGGLEQIMKEITAEAQQEADAILREADAEAEKIRAAGQAEVHRRSIAAAEALENELKKRREMAAAADRQARRQTLLRVRAELIRETLDAAKEQIYSLDSKPYFELLLQLFKRHAQQEDGIILFSKKDLARLPAGFIEQLNSTLERGAVTLSEETAEIDAGFIIRYGDIAQNCSIESMFAERESLLADRVNQCFEGGVDA